VGTSYNRVGNPYTRSSNESAPEPEPEKEKLAQYVLKRVEEEVSKLYSHIPETIRLKETSPDIAGRSGLNRNENARGACGLVCAEDS
jgi:hypothetical protein